MARDSLNTFTKDSWIVDTGATVHMTNNRDYMFDMQEAMSDISMGNDETEKANVMGKINFTLTNSDNKTINITLTDVYYVQNISCNLFSINTVLEKGYILQADEACMSLVHKNHDERKIDCELKFKTENGYLRGLDIKPIESDDTEFNLISIDQMHKSLGHPGKDATLLTAKVNNIEIKGD